MFLISLKPQSTLELTCPGTWRHCTRSVQHIQMNSGHWAMRKEPSRWETKHRGILPRWRVKDVCFCFFSNYLIYILFSLCSMCWKSCWPSQSSSSRSRLSMPCPTATGSTAPLTPLILPSLRQVSSSRGRHRGDRACSTLIPVATPHSAPPPPSSIHLLCSFPSTCHHVPFTTRKLSNNSTTTDAVHKNRGKNVWVFFLHKLWSWYRLGYISLPSSWGPNIAIS